jgi:hypothetical protein
MERVTGTLRFTVMSTSWLARTRSCSLAFHIVASMLNLLLSYTLHILKVQGCGILQMKHTHDPHGKSMEQHVNHMRVITTTA